MGSSDLSAAAGLDATVQAVRRMPVVPLAGKRAAAVQSLLYTSRLNGLDPAAWLRDTLEKLPTCPNSQIDSLLPLRAEALHHPSP